MKKIFTLIGFFCAASLVVSSAYAVDPVPNSEVKEKTENIQSSGAIKRETRPAVPAEKLREQDEMAIQSRPATPADREVAPPRAEQLFGLHAAVGLPHPLNFGLNYVHSSHLFSVELSTGGFGATVSDVKARIENTEIGLRYHPFAGAFFVGALLGTQKISGEKTGSYTYLATTYTGTAKAEVKSNYVTPHVGWTWGGTSTGFFANFEIGAQFPSNVTTDVSSDLPAGVQTLPDYQTNAQDVKDQAEKIGKSVFPYIALIKIGYLF